MVYYIPYAIYDLSIQSWLPRDKLRSIHSTIATIQGKDVQLADLDITMFKHITDIESALGIPLLRTEAALLISIKTNPGMSVKDAMIRSGLSYAGFYNVLDKLIACGAIESRSSETDKRVKCLF